MTKPTIAEVGWLDLTLDHLRGALKAAESAASSMETLRMCDAVGCGRIFDGADPRSRIVNDKGYEYNFCPGCEMDAAAADKLAGRG